MGGITRKVSFKKVGNFHLHVEVSRLTSKLKNVVVFDGSRWHQAPADIISDRKATYRWVCVHSPDVADEL